MSQNEHDVNKAKATKLPPNHPTPFGYNPPPVGAQNPKPKVPPPPVNKSSRP